MDKHDSYWRGEWKHLLGSFRLDRRFLYVLLLEVAFIAALFAGHLVLKYNINQLGPEIGEISRTLEGLPKASTPFFLEYVQGDLTSVYRTMIAYLLVFAAYALLVWTAFKSMIYVVVNKVRFSLGLYWRFFVVNMVWAAVFIFLIYALQMVMFYLLVRSIESSLFSQVFFLVVMSFSLLLLFYLTVSLFTHLTVSCSIKAAVKGFFSVGVRRIRYVLLPVLFQFIVLVLINLLLFILIKMPNRYFMILTSLILLSYFVWLRFYNTAVWYRIRGGGAHPAVHPAAHPSAHAAAHAAAVAGAVVKRKRASGKAGRAKKK